MTETEQKIAPVSGANRGIGAAVAAGLARAGVHVLLGCRDLVAGEEVAAPLRAEGGTNGFKVNAICPGYTAAAATNFMPSRTTEEAAVVILQMALLEDDGPNGGFFNDQVKLPW